MTNRHKYVKILEKYVKGVEKNMNKEELLNLVESLNMPRDEYYILGGGSLVMFGIKDKTADLDLCVSEELFARLKEEYNLDEKDKNECGFYHISDIIEVIPNPKDEFTCEEIEGYQVEELKRILEFKKKRNALKDQPYIEKITNYDNVGHQHYQDFNDARSLFYTNVEWETGYPAATGIGTQCGGIMVDMDVLLCKDETILLTGVDNPLQVAAHAYSQQVLLGETILQAKTTPKFERAKAIWKEDHGFIYISGTAAIRGEQSLEGVGIEEQTLITLENIDYLVSNENLQRAGIPVTKKGELTNFRVYVKYWKDLDKVRRILEAKYPKLPVIYTLTDVCRSELLIEIEGVGLLQ